MFIASLFQFIFTKIDFISFSSFLSLLLSFIRNLLQLCPAPYALILSMLPLANKLYALSTHVPSTLADLVIKSSFAATASPWPNACFAIIHSPIHRFSISDLPRPFSLAISQSTSRIFSSPKNRPCFRRHRLLSRMTALLPTLTHKSKT